MSSGEYSVVYHSPWAQGKEIENNYTAQKELMHNNSICLQVF